MSALVEISIDSWGEQTKLEPSDVEHLKRYSVTPVETRKDAPDRLEYGCNPLIPVSALDAVQRLQPKIVRVVDNDGTRSLAAFGQRSTTIVNEHCRVAVAGLGLLTVDEVQAREDLCTEKLQEALDEGWKILAICVQPDQRRPDYVLGRSKAVSP